MPDEGFLTDGAGNTWPMSILSFLALPAGARQLLVVEVGDGGSLALVRAELRRVLEADQPELAVLLHEVAERVALVATELAGNALRHGLPPVVVRLLRDGDCYLLDVSDHGPHRAPGPGTSPKPVTAGGRGLQISRALAREVCWYSNGATKHVWASFPYRMPQPGGW